ncbi:hypothetical protein RJC76_11940 [Acinetobacter nosocomialis]|uniref:hypothetical protein n=1 Tax=Acinetobacter calcoaceticus/baumannii complex TaxID=909768 RepID=UPI0028701659|nr:hypothetical protein [Acinetobacter nosocomialis]MDR9533133.1 hypothetical protein [Acinetobacter nosocomialis]
MDNCKIKVTDEVSNTEIQEALFELGCEWFGSTNEVKPLANCWIDVGSNGRLTWSFHGSDEKELTLPQLRDLVVLKRNDVRDATHTDGNRKAFLDSAGEYHYWCFHKNEWIDSKHIAYLIQYLKPIQTAQAVLNDLDELREEYKDYHKDPALISGREAWLAFFDGLHVQWSEIDREAWFNFKEEDWNTHSLKNDGFKFRIKPQSIKLELELPKPFEPKEGDEYFYISTLQHCLYSHDVWSDEPADITQAAFGAYRTEDDVKKAVEQLRKIRGTNS